MEQLYLLFQKELLLWRNSYWRTGKQAAITMAVEKNQGHNENY